MQNQKGFILPIIIAVVIIAILGAGGYFAYRQYFLSKPAETGPTAGWKTYTNTEYGFEFQYPKNWNLTLNDNGGDGYTTIVRIVNPAHPGKPDTDIPIEQFFAKFQTSSCNKNTIKSDSGWEQGFGNYYYRDVCFEFGEGSLVVSLDASDGSAKLVMDEIISTFKLTSKPDQTAGPAQNEVEGWKTFRSEIYNYEVKYPDGFEFKNIGKPIDVSQDVGKYQDKDYFYSFSVFARNQDFLMARCLKDLSGNDITTIKEINGNKLYVYEENKVGAGGKMALIQGAIQNEYHIIHNNYCYYITYTILPEDPNTTPQLSQTQDKFKLLGQILSTFKFTK